MTIRLRIICGLVLSTVLASAVVLYATETAPVPKSSDWPHWRGPNYDGISTETGVRLDWPAAGPKVAWRAKVGVGFSSFAVADGKAYTTGNVGRKTDVVWCFDAVTGKQLWKHSYAHPLDPKYYEGGTSATPTVDGKRVYTFSKRGHLFCLNAESGAVIWKHDVQAEFGAEMPTWGFAGSAVILGDRVIVNAGTHGMAFDKTTGKVLWNSGTGPAGYATPVPYLAGDVQCVLMFGFDKLYSVNVADGKMLWEFPWKTRNDVNAADPIISGDRVFISSGYGKGCAVVSIASNSPKLVWRNKKMKNQFSSCVLYGGYLYGFDEKTLRCLDFATGEEKWRYKGLGKGSLMAVRSAGDKDAEGRLILLSDKGRLVIAVPSEKKFDRRAEAKILDGLCWSVPVLSNGRLYVRNAEGDAVCLDLRSE